MAASYLAESLARMHPVPFSTLMLQVPNRISDRVIADDLVGLIAHGSTMISISKSQESAQLIWATTERLFNEADENCFSVQKNSFYDVVGIITHADGMAKIVPQAAAEILALVHPITQVPLPRNDQERAGLSDRITDAQNQMGEISNRIAL